jgi:hypothetical protein
VAQLGARFHGMEEVIGSIPIRSTKSLNNLAVSPPNACTHLAISCAVNPCHGYPHLLSRVLYPGFCSLNFSCHRRRRSGSRRHHLRRRRQLFLVETVYKGKIRPKARQKNACVRCLSWRTYRRTLSFGGRSATKSRARKSAASLHPTWKRLSFPVGSVPA